MSDQSTAEPSTESERTRWYWSVPLSMTVLFASLVFNAFSFFYADTFDFQPDVKQAASTLTKNSSWTLVSDQTTDDEFVIQRWKSTSTDAPTVDSVEAMFKAKGFDNISCRGPEADHSFFCTGTMWSGLGTAYTAVNVESVSTRTELRNGEKEIILISSDALKPR